jgi:DNA-binding IclR family transcriptional regulator
MALTPPLEVFLAGRIDSVETLEVLLLVARGAAPWSAAAAAERLGIDPDVCAAKLDSLASAGLLSRDAGEFRYSPENEDLRKLVAELGREYTDRRANVINVIYSANLDRLRKFAEAFRLRKK